MLFFDNARITPKANIAGQYRVKELRIETNLIPKIDRYSPSKDVWISDPCGQCWEARGGNISGLVFILCKNGKEQCLICWQSNTDWTVRCSFVNYIIRVHVQLYRTFPGRKKENASNETVGWFPIHYKTCKCRNLTNMAYFAALFQFLITRYDTDLTCPSPRQFIGDFHSFRCTISFFFIAYSLRGTWRHFHPLVYPRQPLHMQPHVFPNFP